MIDMSKIKKKYTNSTNSVKYFPRDDNYSLRFIWFTYLLNTKIENIQIIPKLKNIQ